MAPAEEAQKVSLSLGRLKKAPAPTNGVKRSRDAFRDDGDDDEVEERVSKVSHFDSKAGGAVDESNRKVEKAPLVIATQANRDWKEAANKRRRQKHGLPAEAERTGAGGATGEAGNGTTERAKTSEFNAGLQIPNRDVNKALAEVEQTQEVAPEPTAEASVARRTEDEEAMDALLGRTKKSELVVPALTEEDVFDNDVKEAPDMATLEDYNRVPVEQFGAAMLRGMGWKEGDGIGLNKGKKQEKAKIPERRPALLGIGAKEEAAVAQEMGTWGKAARGKGGKEPVIYNPILLKDKKTGEMFTEEEAQKRREKDEREQYEMEFEKKSENGKRARIETGTVGEEEITKTMTGSDGGRKIEAREGTIEETTGTEIVIEKGGGTMTVKMKRNAVAIRRKRNGDAIATMMIMTVSAQGATRRTATDHGTGAASTGGDDEPVQQAIKQDSWYSSTEYYEVQHGDFAIQLRNCLK